jgi:hypothetical protein
LEVLENTVIPKVEPMDKKLKKIKNESRGFIFSKI